MKRSTRFHLSSLATVLALVTQAGCGGGDSDGLDGSAQAGSQGSTSGPSAESPAADQTPPIAAVTGESLSNAGRAGRLTGTASDDTEVFSVGWSNDQGGSGAATLDRSGVRSTTWTIDGIALQPGANRITVTVLDAAGNPRRVVVTLTGAAAPTDGGTGGSGSETLGSGDAGPRIVWVQSGTRTGMDGSQARPWSTIQEALDAAKSSTVAVEVRVLAGSYLENVSLPKLAVPLAVRRHGSGEARLQAKDPKVSALKGFGVKQVTIEGLTVIGGKNGIQFGMSGTDFSKTCEDILVANNVLEGQSEDGIKISQSDRVTIRHNKVTGSGDQGIDFVAVNDSVIVGNDLSGITGASALFAKGGSTNVEISGNHVHGVKVDAIIAGGWTDPKWFRPGFTAYEAKDIRITGNYVEGTGKRPISALGAVDAVISGNIMKTSKKYWFAMTVDKGKTAAHPSRNVSIVNNSFDKSQGLVQVTDISREGYVFRDNRTDGSGSFDFTSVGPR